MKLQNLWINIKKYVRGNKNEVIFVGAILFIGAILRLYKIDEYMTFLGDEGRDAIIVRRLLVYADPILIGPGTSIGNMYLGPLYYYLIAPSLFLANFSPAGPSIFVALVGVATIALLYIVAKEWFGKLAASLAVILYAISPTVIIFSRSSWNPNVMPFFALLVIYSLWRVWQKKEFTWMTILGISYAFVLQSHYLGLVLVPVIGVFWLVSFLKYRKTDLRKFLKHTIVGTLIFLFLMSPLVIFDARHGWKNFSSLRKFFTERQTTVSAKPWSALPNSWPITQQFTTRLLAGREESVGKYAAIGLVGLSFWLLIVGRKNLNSNERKAYLLLFTWLIASIVGLGVYKQHIYDHYYGFFFAAPFLLFGGLIQTLRRQDRRRLLSLAMCGFIVLVSVNLYENPLKYPSNKQLNRSVAVSRKIIEEAKGEKFNFAVVAERNYEGAYRYFLDLYKAPVVDIDPRNTSDTIADQLFVVCEMPKEKCDPTHNAKAEVANFGWSKVANEWEEFGTRIYKLEHTQ